MRPGNRHLRAYKRAASPADGGGGPCPAHPGHHPRDRTVYPLIVLRM
ncbi:hypothetical protein UO65_4335 [Actinokineospora spheciospongiae]|uniref:Uncharacterized protein n=1 Tax=Actinokineospora spheciospongiae TaxID=909613 RepID=W7IHJ6_9PSEU|nr:hypothetical protein UO65_4335 [Actinokineospora spheciospongiae]